MVRIQPRVDERSGAWVVGEGREVVLVNPHDRWWTRGSFVLWFGAHAPTYLRVWANGIDSALDECVDWLAEHAPGLLCNEPVAEEYERAIAEGLDESAAYERAVQDVTIAGNCGDHLLSWEWGIALDTPTRAQFHAFLGGG